MYTKDQKLTIVCLENNDLSEEITVTESVTGLGEFTGNVYDGYIGKTASGRTFGYNYPTANEGYGETMWMPYLPDEEFEELSEEEKTKFVEHYFWKDTSSPVMSIAELFAKCTVKEVKEVHVE